MQQIFFLFRIIISVFLVSIISIGLLYAAYPTASPNGSSLGGNFREWFVKMQKPCTNPSEGLRGYDANFEPVCISLTK